jgi:hypothetical protein
MKLTTHLSLFLTSETRVVLVPPQVFVVFQKAHQMAAICLKIRLSRSTDMGKLLLKSFPW